MLRTALAGALLLLLVGCHEKSVPTGSSPALPASPAALCAPLECCYQGPVVVRQNPVLLAGKAAGPATGTVQVCNKGATPTRLALSLDQLTTVDGDRKPQPLGVYAKLEAAVAAEKPIADGGADLGAGKCIALTVTPPAEWAAAAATISLSNEAKPLATLQIARQQPPFGVRIDGASPNEATLRLITGNEAIIPIRNDDPLPYRFQWRIAIGDERLQGVAYVAVHGAVDLHVRPSGEFLDEFMPYDKTPSKNRWFGGFLRNGTLRSATPQGTLTLRWEPGIPELAIAIPEKQIPLKSQMSFFGEGWQFVLNNLSILVLLLIGVLLSWAMNFGLPNQSKRVAMRQRLADIDSQIRDLRSGGDHRLIAVANREYQRLRQDLGQRFWFSPEFTTALPKLEEGIASLKTRLVLLRIGAELLCRREPELPPSVALEARQACLLALAPLQHATLDTAQLESVRERLAAAAALATPEATPPRTADLKAREERLATLVPTLKDMKGAGKDWSQLAEPMSGLFLAFEQRGAAADRMEASAFRMRDMLITRMESLAFYVELQKQAVDQAEKTAREKHLPDLQRAITPGKDYSLMRAAELLQQMEKNVYVEDLVAAIKAGAFNVDVDPPSVEVNEVVDISIKFDAELLNRSSARQELACQWVFRELGSHRWRFRSKGSEEASAQSKREWRDRGWNLSLAFFNAGDYEATVKFDQQGKAVEAVDKDGKSLLKNKIVPVKKGEAFARSRLNLELIRLGGLVLVLLFPLVTGARDKLASMDLVAGSLAVVALGFTADTVIKRLTQST